MKKFSWCFVIALAGCASSTKSTTSAILNVSDIALLNAAVDLQDELGDSVWPGFGKFRTAVLYQKKKGQVLLNAPSAPDYYAQYKSVVPFWGKPAFITSELRSESGTILTRQDYETNFYASAYSSEQTNRHYPYSVFVLDSMEQFHLKGNAWPVEDWLSIFWHEVFHNFQDSQYAASIVSPAITDFTNVQPLLDDINYRALLLSELKLISRALKLSNKSTRQKILCSDLHVSRIKRNAYLQKKKLQNSIPSEQFYETSEGTARYTEEMMSLAVSQLEKDQLDKKLADARDGFEYTSFKKYRERSVSTYYDRIRILHEGERYFYQTGFALALALDSLDKDWKNKVFRIKGGLYPLLRQYCDQGHGI